MFGGTASASASRNASGRIAERFESSIAGSSPQTIDLLSVRTRGMNVMTAETPPDEEKR